MAQSGVLSLQTQRDGPAVGYLTTGSSIGAIALSSGTVAAVGSTVVTPQVHTLALGADGFDDLVVLAANARKLHLLQVSMSKKQCDLGINHPVRVFGRRYLQVPHIQQWLVLFSVHVQQEGCLHFIAYSLTLCSQA